MLSANPLIPSLGPISTLNTQFWNFTSANVSIYGTNAYNISNQSNNMVLTNQSSSAVLAASNSTQQQIWVIQPVDLVTGYRLPFSLGTTAQQMVYNKILKIPNGPTVFGTNSVTDWGTDDILQYSKHVKS